jgi:G patch domain-containing protein 1
MRTIEGVSKAQALVDPERNEALEKERPNEALFRAIFGDSDDDE